MIALLGELVGLVEAIPDLILYAIETVVNTITSAFAVVVDAALAVLPSLPATFAPPTILGWLNFFFPVGLFVSVASGLVGCYIAFLGIRWILKKAGVF